MLFNRNKKLGKANKLEEIIIKARISLVGTGPYASMSISDEWQEGQKIMLQDLHEFEEYAERYSSSTLFGLAGQGWALFSIWYRRKNDDKTTPLRKAIALTEKALTINSNNEEAKSILGEILIERVQVRDLERGLKLLEELDEKDYQIQGLISKAKRWLGKLELDTEFEYPDIPLIPLTVLREERAKCRAQIRTLKKGANKEELILVLDHMYRLAILHDAATFVMLNTEHSFNEKETRHWDNLLKKLAKRIEEYSYSNNGRIKESNNCFLTNNDYKTFSMIFSDSSKILDPVALIKQPK